MFIKQLYTNCLAQAAYYVESDGEALIIDPLRDPAPYIELAKERKAKIKYIFETHFHADFISGHLELSTQTGAVVVYGPLAKPKYQALIAFDGELFPLGKIKIKVLHTPGHTIESSCFLLYDEMNKPNSIFTGDTLFVGDVGRPDLFSGKNSKEELAGMLYESLNKKIKNLPDHIIIYPGHGAGSACGKNIGSETTSTIGEQKLKNYALQNQSKADFIKNVIQDLPDPPAYFFKDAMINMEGYDGYDNLMKRELRGLNVEEVKSQVEKGAIILDTRKAGDFENGYIPGSINIGLDGDFAIWSGTILEFNSPIVIVAESGKEKESIMRLARIGYDNVKGYLAGGYESWIKSGEETDDIKSVDYSNFKYYTSDKNCVILDVRKPDECDRVRIEGSVNIPLNLLAHKITELNKGMNYLVYCAGGYRSMIAVSLLKKHGIANIINLKGGINSYDLKAA